MSGFSQGAFGALPFGEASNPPFIGNWAPFLGDYVPRLALVEFDVTSESWVVYDTIVRAVFTSGLQETVFTDAGGFTDLYRRGSGRKPISGGYRYYVRRTGGWLTAVVRMAVTAADLAESVSSVQSQ